MSEEEKLLKEAKKLPWEDRLLHKNWKVRNEANIDLAALCDSITDPKDNRIRELGQYSFIVSDLTFVWICIEHCGCEMMRCRFTSIYSFVLMLGPLFKKTVADSNAPVQDKALDALIAYLKAADADAGRCNCCLIIYIILNINEWKVLTDVVMLSLQICQRSL